MASDRFELHLNQIETFSLVLIAYLDREAAFLLGLVIGQLGRTLYYQDPRLLDLLNFLLAVLQHADSCYDGRNQNDTEPHVYYKLYSLG